MFFFIEITLGKEMAAFRVRFVFVSDAELCIFLSISVSVFNYVRINVARKDSLALEQEKKERTMVFFSVFPVIFPFFYNIHNFSYAIRPRYLIAKRTPCHTQHKTSLHFPVLSLFYHQLLGFRVQTLTFTFISITRQERKEKYT